MLFFFNDTATTEIYTLSLHDALPILLMAPGATGRAQAVHLTTHAASPCPGGPGRPRHGRRRRRPAQRPRHAAGPADRKSTRLNSSHANISYAVFCLKKKKHERRPVRP